MKKMVRAALLLIVASLLVRARSGAAQTPPLGSPAPRTAESPATSTAASEAAATITAAAIAPYLAMLTTDSLCGRATPSPALERTAEYVAAQFQRIGLTPGGALDDEAEPHWQWRYPLPGQLMFNYDLTRLRFNVGINDVRMSPSPSIRPFYDETGNVIYDREVIVPLATTAYLAPDVAVQLAEALPQGLGYIGIPGSDHTLLVAGRQTTASLPLAELRDQAVLYVPFAETDSATQRQLLTQLTEASAGVVILDDADSAGFAAAHARVRARRVPVVERYMRNAAGRRRWPWAVVVQAQAPGVRTLFAPMDVDVTALRHTATPVVRALPKLAIWMRPVVDTTGLRQTAPTVVGVLEGTDSVLKHEYLVFTSHMDAGGVCPGRSDSLVREADENAVSTAGLIALAQAFSQPGARPRRSLLLLATSGGAAPKLAWASNAYFDRDHGGPHRFEREDGGPYRFAFTGALTLDMVGHLRGGDTVLIDGLSDVELAKRPEWLAAEHPELGLVVADGGTAIRPTSDQFAFMRGDVPSLLIHAGVHPDAPPDTYPGLPLDVSPDSQFSPSTNLATAASADTVRAEESARLLRFVFYLGETIANAERGLRWSAAGRRGFMDATVP